MNQAHNCNVKPPLKLLWIKLRLRFPVEGFQGYTIKLLRANLSKAGNVTCAPAHVKGQHTQFTCGTCSLPAKQLTLPESTRQALHTVANGVCLITILLLDSLHYM